MLIGILDKTILLLQRNLIFDCMFAFTDRGVPIVYNLLHFISLIL